MIIVNSAARTRGGGRSLCLLCFVLFLLFANYYFLTKLHGFFIANKRGEVISLDGCYHVYLDIGSNVGLQVRKLYEPELFDDPVPPAAAYYDRFFGPRSERDNKREICTVGFEPNPTHRANLLKLQKSYRDCGYNVKFFTLTAVSSSDGGEADFFTDDDDANHEWGASIIGSNNNLRRKKGKVRLIRLAKFINEVVASRYLRESDPISPPSVLMKMDIEGAELEVISDMLVSGAMRHVNLTMIEWHWHITAQGGERIRKMEQLAKGVETIAAVSGLFSIESVEDETHIYDALPAHVAC